MAEHASTEEQIEVKTFDAKASDDTLIEIFTGWLKESRTYHDELLPRQTIAEQYYIGNQTDKYYLAGHRANHTENRIFEGVETIVPIVTAHAHQFLVKPGSDSEVSIAKAESLQKFMTVKHRKLGMQEKNETAVRHMLVYIFGVQKWFWNHKTDDLDCKVIDPRLLLVPKLRLDPHQLPYKIEIHGFLKEELEEEFPGVKIEDIVSDITIETGESRTGEQKKVIKVFEVWTPETRVFFAGTSKVLKKDANPYWDFGTEEEEEETDEKGKTKKKKKVIFRNHFDVPTDPYVFIHTFNISSAPFAPVSLVNILIDMQDTINKRSRGITDNLNQMGNGQVLIDSDAMSQEVAENITNEPGSFIRGKGVASENKIRREPGVPLPNAHFAALQHAESAFDNIMGIHAPTRGQGGKRTLGQDIISRQQDFTRIDLITRALNRSQDRGANWIAQLVKMFYDETHVEKIIGEDGAIEFIKLTREDVEDFIEIEVKAGEQLPMDDISLRNEAIQLSQLGLLAPVDLFEKLGFLEPEKTAAKLLAWKQGQLDMETLAKIQEIEAGAKTKEASRDAPSDAENAKGRGVESPLNVLQRARANVGGTAPVAPGTPK